MKIVFATRSLYPKGVSESRRSICEAVTIRSLTSQTDQSFEWWIRTDEPTRFASCGLQVSTCKNFKSLVDSQTTPFVMFRLDDDDAVSTDFVARVRGFLASNDLSRPLLSFPCGYALWRRQVRQMTHPTNMFIGRVNGNIFDRNHNHWPKRLFHFIDTKPAWLWVRHAESASAGGRLPGVRVLTKLPIWRRFGIDWAVALSASDGGRQGESVSDSELL